MEKLNKIFKTSEIPEIDLYTVRQEPILSIDLMERASRVWTENFLETFPECKRVAVITGHGNNGGDGYAIARLLMGQGVETQVFRLVLSGEMSQDCRTNYLRYLERGGDVTEVREADDVAPVEGCCIIDAIFGTGINRRVTGLAASVIAKVNRLPNLVVAVDVPSGLKGEDNAGRDVDAIVRADYTFTFQFPKVAFMLPENESYVGKWKVLDIGLHPDIIARKPASFYYLTENRVAEMLPRTPKFAHKGINGRGLLIAGARNMMGAAVLAAKAAVRSGAGLLYCHVPALGRDVIHTAVPEALLELDESENCFSEVRKAGQYDAVAIGPALGKNPETVQGLRDLLKQWRGTTIIDADALNILSEHRELLELLHEGCILTPHFKEFERLAGKSVNDFERLNKLSTFAGQYRVCVVLKGAHTVIAAPDGTLIFNMSGNPGMAKGGAGDVLTGVLLGLACNGLAPLEAALIGVFAHGLAGDIAAEAYGERGICAGLLAEGMGKAWKRLEAGNRKFKRMSL